jgi:hypothetical protein
MITFNWDRILIAFLIVSLIFVASSPLLVYYSNCREARVFNSLNGTKFTCGDFFWAGEQINTRTQTINLEYDR